MPFSFGPRIRHPFFPWLTPTPAGEAKSVSSALYGSFPELIRAAHAGAQASRAVFVTLRQQETPLTDRQRDTLWELFQVPSFVLLLDGKRHLLAYECEAQSGLHVNPKYPIASSTAAACECGRPGDKLVLTPAAPLRVA